jgi:hypothetical protein
MSKFSAIQQQLEKASGRKGAVDVVSPPTVAPTPPAPANIETAPPVAPYKAPSREGKIHVGAYLNPDFKRSMRLVQAQTDEDVQQLLARALNELFRAHNVPVVDQD